MELEILFALLPKELLIQTFSILSLYMLLCLGNNFKCSDNDLELILIAV